MSWTKLPKELKQDVVGRLDLMSRHSMRCTSRLDRSIVDSMEYRIPRVKFSLTQEKYSIMIFMGIKKWVEFQVWKGDKKETLYKRLDNTLDPRNSPSKVSSLTPSDLAVAIMASLLSHDFILIDMLEWSIYNDEKSKSLGGLLDALQLQMTKSILEKLKEHTGKKHFFRVKRTYTTGNNAGIDTFLLLIGHPKDLKGVDKLMGDRKGNASFSIEVCLGEKNGLSHRIHQQHGELFPLEPFYEAAASSPGAATLRFAKLNDETRKIWRSVKQAEKRHGNLRVKTLLKQVNRSTTKTFYHCMSPCGYWITSFDNTNVDVKKNGYLNEYLNAPHCRLGTHCQKCSDPFDFWYDQNSKYWYSENAVKQFEFDETFQKLNSYNPDVGEGFLKVNELSMRANSLRSKLDNMLEVAKHFPEIMNDPEYAQGIKTATELSNTLKDLSEATGNLIENTKKAVRDTDVIEVREALKMVQEPEPKVVEIVENSEVLEDKKPELFEPQMVPVKIEPAKDPEPTKLVPKEPEFAKNPSEVSEPQLVPGKIEPAKHPESTKSAPKDTKISKSQATMENQKHKVSEHEMVPEKIEPTKMVPKEPESDVYTKIAQNLVAGVRNRRASASGNHDELDLDASVDYVSTAGPGQFDEYMERRRIMDNEGNEHNLARLLALAGFMIYFSGALYVLFHVVLWFG